MVKCQASSLLGKMETLGPVGAAAAERRGQAAAVEARWRRESRAFQLANRGSWIALCTGFARLKLAVPGVSILHLTGRNLLIETSIFS